MFNRAKVLLNILFLLIFFFIALPAKNPRVRHIPVDTIAHLPKLDSGFVRIIDLFTDTIRSDSFYKYNFANYLLPKKQIEPDSVGYNNYLTHKPSYRRDWVFYFVAFILILLLFIKYNFSKLYRNALASFFNRAATAEIINDKYSPRWLFVLFANLFFILVMSLWFYRNFITLDPPLYEEKLETFGLIILLLILIYILKFSIHLMFGALFRAAEAVVIYILNISITNLACGIVMLLTTLFLLYSPWHGQPWLLSFSFGIIIGFVVLRYLRGLRQTIQYFKYNYLYLILYLCALEIAPWFLIIKYLNKFL